MRWTLPLLFVLVFSGCSHLRPTPPRACLSRPPPVLQEVVTLGECPVGDLVVCLDKKNAQALARYLQHGMDWMGEAWTRCGPGEQ